ncbi:molybdopterin-synthase adenylyltransferase MoeB [Legionella oakridgensis]|uniref:Molybdopterin-synthase adenylyltransferase n=2 Tax=Legionella oakridgensis TaxID=29423 RepID=W0BGL6_9GAMM|nr:molybdopterin-synthase adenylyltransferase MoeB [Legionella oakridgensis]AHE67579.1 dinucleotide-utilizing enzymes involved in molybdopterin and thiamine biosynthesis family 2 [Legionella oakridgensis ATCC 33761 = DSM 21215]ETO92822.1 dinucleotide-utilizing enzyme involved in molybdopterin and thiamine biosynthesis family 2 [Legionella oakridgensis RV-2-2007]KTD37072.1 thiazole biosynthesis adenylyltransferase ThiF [Legionella oakridgensis]STY20619.1 thiazole biosynthesis adenylyltransferase
MDEFNQSEFLRYQRHFPVIGVDGQRQLKQAKVLCVGSGGLGCPALQYLAAAGVGTLGIVDGDMIELSNLQRQILFQTADIGRNKAEVACERLLALNPEISINAYTGYLSNSNAEKIINHFDVVLDATDNYEARYLLNETCRTLNIPLISASIYQFDAQLSVFNYKNGPCYQCLYPSPPPPALTPNCALGGVLGVLPGVIGTMQAAEAIKVILGIGDVLSGTLLSLDLLSMRFTQFEIEKQHCALHPAVSFHTDMGINSCREIVSVTALELSHLLSSDSGTIQLIDVRQPYERKICHIGGKHIPLVELDNYLEQMPKDQDLVLYCKSGARSAQACRTLQNAGFINVRHLKGGILEWIESVDSSLMKY